MNMMEKIYETAKASPQRIAFPEAEEEKILLAAREACDKGVCIPYMVGDARTILDAAQRYGVSVENFVIIDVCKEDWLNSLIADYVKKSPLMNSEKTMLRKSKDTLYIALMMQARGDVDATFAGMIHTTGEVILAAQFVIGLQDGVTIASSIGIFDIPGYEGSEGSLLAFGDSAVCAQPDEEELAGIAIAACETVESLLGWEPRCAFLSFSTDGSTEHAMVDKTRGAIAIAKKLRPDLKIDGEFQLDAAISPSVATKKVKRESEVAGKANIIIWPDLNVGNIGVKLVQQFAHADAYGPTLQGFAQVVSDCSRSAPVSELVGNIAMTVVRAQKQKKKGV
ncbi:MAG: phosphate acetyltransferase [Bacillota bacterium]|jgi:phosphate acetyltransferase|nr:phosphate acetyltransferase [Bacillota bacterium]